MIIRSDDSESNESDRLASPHNDAIYGYERARIMSAAVISDDITQLIPPQNVPVKSSSIEEKIVLNAS